MDRWTARAEAKLAGFGPGRAERLRLALDEADAAHMVLDFLADEEAAEAEARIIDAIADWFDIHRRRGARQAAGDGEAA